MQSDLENVTSLVALSIRLEGYKASGRLNEAKRIQQEIAQIIRAAIASPNPMIRFMLEQVLGVLQLPESAHVCLVDITADTLDWQTSVALLQSINWDFRHYKDESERLGYARRSAARLRKSVALLESNLAHCNVVIYESRMLLAQALSLFDQAMCLAELMKVEQACQQFSASDRHKFLPAIGALRSALMRK